MQLVVIAHNIRSTHNVGSIFRTCEGFGVEHLYLTGYSPFPSVQNDSRLPHIREKLTAQIHKTALGAETMLPFSYSESIAPLLTELKRAGFSIIGLEQTKDSILLQDFQPPQKVALLLGEEVDGISAAIQQLCDTFIEIPMDGKKESFNVSVATGIAIFGIQYPRLTSKS